MFWGVLLAGVAAFIIGMLWYSPVLFGNVWMKLSGINPKDAKKRKQKGMFWEMLVNFIAGVVMALVFNEILRLGNGFSVAFMVWIGFIATTMLGSVLWEGKSFKLYLINSLYYLVSLIVMSLILKAF